MTNAEEAQPKGSCPDTAATCKAIQAASTEAEVMAIVRRYLASLDSSVFTAVPASLLAVHVNHAKDIAAAAVELARHEATVASGAPEAAPLRELATVLSTAAMRLAIITIQ